MIKKDLKIPWALDKDGVLINANDASKKNEYHCPCCKEVLVLKKGKVKKSHYAHKVETNCESESAYHKLSKILIAHAIEINAKKEKEIKLEVNCFGCGERYAKKIEPGFFKQCILEKLKKPYICDIVATSVKNKEIAIEIFYTHECEDEKKENLCIPWIELKAEDVIENPFIWKCYDYKIDLTFCKKCRNHFSKVVALCDEFNIQKESYTPFNIFAIKTDADYIADIYTCYRCDSETPVFFAKMGDFNKTYKPFNIKYVFSKNHSKSYWTNTCIKCGVIIGESYLRRDTSHISFQDDYEYFQSKWFGSEKSKGLFLKKIYNNIML